MGESVGPGGLGLIWGNLRELHFGDIEHVMSDFWRSMYSCSFLGWGRQHGLAHGVWPNGFLHFSDRIQDRHVLLFYVLCSQNTVNAMISLFWEESAFQHWSLQKWQKLTKVVDTSLLHKRTVGSTSTLFGSCLDWYASTLSKDCEGHNPTSSGHLKHFNFKGVLTSPSQIDFFFPWWRDADAGNGRADMQGALTSLRHLL